MGIPEVWLGPLVLVSENWRYYYPLKHLSFVQREYEGIWTDSNESRCFWTAASYRHSLGKYWKQRQPCQYPMHHGGRKAIKSRDVVNVNMAKEIKKLHGVIYCVNRFRFDNCLCILALCLFVCLFVCLFLLHMQVDLHFSPKKIQCPIFSKFFKNCFISYSSDLQCMLPVSQICSRSVTMVFTAIWRYWRDE